MRLDNGTCIVLRIKPGVGPSPSPQPPSSPTLWARKGGGWRSRADSIQITPLPQRGRGRVNIGAKMLAPPHAMVAQARYVHDEKARFLISLQVPIRITHLHRKTDEQRLTTVIPVTSPIWHGWGNTLPSPHNHTPTIAEWTAGCPSTPERGLESWAMTRSGSHRFEKGSDLL